MANQLTYYSQRKSILNGEPQAIVNKYGSARQMERQYHLFCANACDGEAFPFDTDSIEWGTIEHGVIARTVYIKQEEIEPVEQTETEVEQGE